MVSDQFHNEVFCRETLDNMTRFAQSRSGATQGGAIPWKKINEDI
jgi:hypothetical protein